MTPLVFACDASREDARRQSMDYSVLSPRTNEAPAITNESRKKAKRQRRPNAYTQTHTQTRTHTNAYTAEGARNSQGKNSLCLALLVNGRAWWVLAKRFRPPSLESYKDPAGVRGRRILYRILSRLLLVLYIGVGIDLPSKIIGLHWRRIRPDPGPAPHLKCDLFHRIRLGWRRIRAPSAPAPHLKCHLLHRIRLGWHRVGRPSAVAPHLNCHLFHLIRLG